MEGFSDGECTWILATGFLFLLRIMAIESDLASGQVRNLAQICPITLLRSLARNYLHSYQKKKLQFR